MTAEAAVALCPSLAELSKGGKFTAAGVKARIRSVTAELKQALAARLAAKAAATEAATAAAEIAAGVSTVGTFPLSPSHSELHWHPSSPAMRCTYAMHLS